MMRSEFMTCIFQPNKRFCINTTTRLQYFITNELECCLEKIHLNTFAFTIHNRSIIVLNILSVPSVNSRCEKRQVKVCTFTFRFYNFTEMSFAFFSHLNFTLITNKENSSLISITGRYYNLTKWLSWDWTTAITLHTTIKLKAIPQNL